MIKQVILVRSDLGMPLGKAVAQGAHASMMFITKRLQKMPDAYTPAEFSSEEWDWINGIFTKIVLEVKSEAELLALHFKALAANLESHVVLDCGKTHTKGVATNTCCAIGPADSDKINAITGHLRPYLQGK